MIFLPTGQLGLAGRLFVILSSYMSINALLAQGGDIIQKYTYGLLAALLVIGVGLSYFFLLPVALSIFILSIAADYFYSDQKVKLSKLLMSSLLFAASLSVLQGAFIC